MGDRTARRVSVGSSVPRRSTRRRESAGARGKAAVGVFCAWKPSPPICTSPSAAAAYERCECAMSMRCDANRVGVVGPVAGPAPQFGCSVLVLICFLFTHNTH